MSGESLTALVLEQYRPEEETPQEDAGCGGAGDRWGEVNRYYNQSSIYLQSGQAVHANSPMPGRYRICMTGGLVTKIASSRGFAGRLGSTVVDYQVSLGNRDTVGDVLADSSGALAGRALLVGWTLFRLARPADSTWSA